MKNSIFFAIIATAVTITACSDSNSWTVKGNISGANDKTILVQASDNGRWYTLDSIKTGKSGKFNYSHKAAGFPDIYRLSLDGRSIYFPIDSIETVTISADTAAFDTGYTLSGSQLAENMMNIDRRIMTAVAAGTQVASDEQLKRELTQQLLADPAGILSYYIINKNVGGKPIFNPADKKDNKVIGAVANAYNIMRPADPRTSYLKRLYLSNRPRIETNEPGDTLHAREIKAFEINLYDNRGTRHSLLEELGKSNIVILNFTAYAADESPAFNIALNKVYEKYHANGLEIFQVSLDDNEHVWKSTAANLPWITVLNSVADNTVILNYNVQSLPTTYIFNRNGELVERVDDITTLDKAVAGFM
ncbi:MAG: AhpC/TSA family protein [Duncaniella sp.]|nr:AhpC/TSA family protein [Duncaniella sp.]